jgi:peptidoglycan hydrolase-like protein with peptidoglycan-binding domain
MRKLLLTSVFSLSIAAVPALAQGSQTVRDAQQALKDKGFDPGPVDGVNGPKTRSATRAYQKQQNLDADGRLGTKTLDSLGVKHEGSGTEFKASGEQVKNGYTTGGKDVGHGGKELGTDVKDGHPVEGAKDFGKDVGHGAAKIGESTGHAAKSAAKGVTSAVTGDKDKKQQ